MIRVFSPPSGQAPLETSAPLGKDVMAARGDVSFGGAAWGPSLSTYRVALARGITDELDLSIAPSLMWVHERGPYDSHPGIYTLRLGIKYARTRYVALSAGLGGGGSAGGAFLSPDVGVIAGYENPILVPFGSLRGFVSAPFARRTVEIWSGTADDPPEDRIHRLKPDFTYGVQTSVGVKLPFVRDARALVRPALSCGLTATLLSKGRKGEDRDTYMMLDCGLEAVF